MRWLLAISTVALITGAYVSVRGETSETSRIEHEMLEGRPLLVGASAREYSLALTTAVDEESGHAIVRYTLRGKLSLVPRDDAGGRSVVQASLRDASLSDVNFSNPDQILPPDFLKSFEAPCFFTFDQNGRIADIRVSRAAPSFAQTTWKIIAGAVQTSAPERVGQRSWTTLEHDAAGEYRVRYDATDLGLSKHKLAYTSSAGALGAKQTVELARTDFTFESGRLERLDAHERVRAVPESPWPTMISEVRLALRSASPSSPAPSSDWRAAFDASVPSGLAAPTTLDARRADSDRARSHGANFEGLLVLAKTGNEKEKLGAYQTLVSLLRVDETVAGRTEQIARSGAELGSWMTAALGDAGCNACQDALGNLLNDRALGSMQRLAALQALGRVEQPSSRAQALVRSLLDDPELGFQAKLSLGSAIFRLRESDPRHAAELLELLEARVRSGAHDDTVECLKAIGNAGSVESLPLLTSQLAQSNAAIRAGAALALRRMRDPRAEALLVRTIAHDNDAQVKVAALEASRQLGISPALLAAIVPLIDDEHDPVAQSAAVSVIGSFGAAARTPDVESALQRVIARTEVDSLRESAQRVLERVRGNG